MSAIFDNNIYYNNNYYNISIDDNSSNDDNNSSDSSSEDNTNINNNNNDETYMCCKFYNITENGKCHVTWQLAMKDSSIKSIQEPISEMIICKKEFNDAYNKFMDTLDGRDMTSFVDFFWRRSAIDSSSLEFIDRDTRMDIYEYLRDEDLIPDMEQVHSGDWKFKK